MNDKEPKLKLTQVSTEHDPYEDPLLYERILTDDLGDLSYYMAQAKAAAGPVLELACGTGRLTLPLAQAGIAICGLDNSEPMLKVARQRANERGIKVDLVNADMRDFALNKKFALIILAYNALQHMETRQDIESLLTNVHGHLTPDGVFALDVHNPCLLATP